MPSPWDQFAPYAPPPQAPANAQPQLEGPEYADALRKRDPARANIVQAMIEGRQPFPGAFALKSPQIQSWIRDAATIDPNFDAANWQQRVATRKNYLAGGKQFQELQALNTVGGHLKDLMETADKLNNTNIPYWNKIANFVQSQGLGDPRVKDFHTAYTAVTNELAKAYHGGHVSDSAVRDWQNAISSADSPEQFRTVIGRLAHLLNSKISATEEGYRQGMGKAPAPEEYSALYKPTQKTFQDIGNWSLGLKPQEGAASPAATNDAARATMTAPKPGRYIYDPATGTMKPAQ